MAWAVHLLIGCLFFGQIAAWGAADDHDHDHEAPRSKKGSAIKDPDRGREAGGRDQRGYEDTCQVSPQRLADFANGEGYDFGNLVTYLSAPACGPAAGQMSRAAISAGVNFRNVPPIRLDNLAKGIPRNDLETSKRLDLTLAKSVPALLRQNPMGTEEMLPILGQLSLLSQNAGRAALSSLIRSETSAGDDRIQNAPVRGKPAAAAELSRSLLRLGLGESAIAIEVAEGIEDDALLGQADSLAHFFRGLAAAASVEAALVPAFNLSAGAFNRGVQRGNEFYEGDDKSALLVSAFGAMKASLDAGGSLEPGAIELNDALAALLDGRSLSDTALRGLWREATRVLAQSPTQSALAEAVASSLTPQMIFLAPKEKEMLMAAAKNYPSLAGSVQNGFLRAWLRARSELYAGRVKTKVFNRMRDKYFEPMTTAILDFDPYLIDAMWLNEALRRGLIGDEEIEKRFPRFVLAYLDRRDKASRVAANDSGLEPMASAMAENLAVLWTLSNVHVPALMKWVKKYEQ